jgi:hypothetical protein
VGKKLHNSCIFIPWKMLVFWGIGIRLVTAGLRQIIKPAFTAEAVFKLRSAESHIVIRELGFASLPLGLMAGTSLFFPSWLLPAACMGIFFYGVAGIQHVIKRPVTANQWIALVSDLYISIVLLACLVASRAGEPARSARNPMAQVAHMVGVAMQILSNPCTIFDCLLWSIYTPPTQ